MMDHNPSGSDTASGGGIGGGGGGGGGSMQVSPGSGVVCIQEEFIIYRPPTPVGSGLFPF